MQDQARLGDRGLFPRLRAKAYLSHAAVSPPSSAVTNAVARCLDDYAQGGVSAAITQRGHAERTREKAARLIGAEAKDVAFILSTSVGVITVARSIPWQAGDRIVCFEGEFPANVTPWQMVAKDLGLPLAMLSLAPFHVSHDAGLHELERELKKGARLVAVSAVQFQTGLRMPLAEMATLCHRYGAELFVDAIQGLGVLPIDVAREGIDYLVAGGHKFLMGLEGAGIAYVCPKAMTTLSLSYAGWTGHEDAFRFLVKGPGELRYDRPIARRVSVLEQGALSMTAIAALDASLDILLGLGVDTIFAHVTRYLDALEPELRALDLASARSSDRNAQSATLSVRLPDGLKLSDVAHALSDDGIIVSTPDGFLRFAPHWPNSLDEIPIVVDATKRALSR